MRSPRTPHLQAVHYLLRYLKQTLGQDLFFSAHSKINLNVYVDADWGSCVDTRKSTTGFAIFLGNSLIAWKSKKQATVSHSSAEAKYKVIVSVTSEILWHNKLL